MYIVNRGRLQVVGDNGKTVMASLKAGSYFGEISILNMGTAGKALGKYRGQAKLTIMSKYLSSFIPFFNVYRIQIYILLSSSPFNKYKYDENQKQIHTEMKNPVEKVTLDECGICIQKYDRGINLRKTIKSSERNQWIVCYVPEIFPILWICFK